MDPNTLVNMIAFVGLTLLWLFFLAALLFKHELLEQAWRTFRSWPLLAQLVVALFTLPVVIGLWIWQMKWPAWLRVALVVGLAWVTIYTFFPALQTT